MSEATHRQTVGETGMAGTASPQRSPQAALAVRAFEAGTMSAKEFAAAGRDAGLPCSEVAALLRSRLRVESLEQPVVRQYRLNPSRLVLISDTHGCHRNIAIPPGDVLIHAGDFTKYGRIEDATDFNAWLGTLPHRHKVIVLGNHEANAPWRHKAQSVLSNATLLCQQCFSVEGLQLFGTDFFWPMDVAGGNPHFDTIPVGVDVIITHGPAAGYVDGGSGCGELLRCCRRVKPRVVVSGHIHTAHGISEGTGDLSGTIFCNAANALKGHGHMGWEPIVIDV